MKTIARTVSVLLLALTLATYLAVRAAAKAWEAQVDQVQARVGDLAYVAPPGASVLAHVLALVAVVVSLVGVVASWRS